MGKDKALIHYHGVEQWKYCVQLLSPVCKKVFVSCRQIQKEEINIGNLALIDEIEDAGPASGLHAAFSQFPTVAWLILACDFPFVLPGTIQTLIQARDIQKEAIAFQSDDGLPEPFLAIWEPALCGRFLAAFSPSISARKTLASSHWSPIIPSSRSEILNVNNPQARSAT